MTTRSGIVSLKSRSSSAAAPKQPTQKALKRLFKSTEKVDSVYHAFAFIITHPNYVTEAAKILELEKPGIFRSNKRIVGGNQSSPDESTPQAIAKLSSFLLIVLNLLMIFQIIGLYAFITSLSSPECVSDIDCPSTTFCYGGPISNVIIADNAEASCISCSYLIGDETKSAAKQKIWSMVSEKIIDLNTTDLPTNCVEFDYYSNNLGNSINSIVAMTLVAGTVGMYLAKEEGEIMLSDIFLRRSGWSWWRYTYYDDDKLFEQSLAKIPTIDQARFEMFQFLRRFTMQVQIAICTVMVLTSATNAKDYFLDATAVLFVVELDNLLFKTLVTGNEREFFLETTKVVLDETETYSLKVGQYLHGLILAIEIVALSVWVKSSGMSGSVRSVADLPSILVIIFSFTQVIVGTGVLFFSSYCRNSARWTRRKAIKKLFRSLLYNLVGGVAGSLVAMHHVWGVLIYMMLVMVVNGLVWSHKKTAKNLKNQLTQERMNKIKERLKGICSDEEKLTWLQRLDYYDGYTNRATGGGGGGDEKEDNERSTLDLIYNEADQDDDRTSLNRSNEDDSVL
ncbi:hypothetical protein TrVE_jg7099 [Triparma verrucosa]|uniref:Uncharacterized protein n=1 Tax=Triparma verrucosa TaxID=1606542 RepID=A0A9W7FDI9_9STRA|nr:hypothetical protein TrVE_jg7099 [Triparma verrucosa]